MFAGKLVWACISPFEMDVHAPAISPCGNEAVGFQMDALTLFDLSSSAAAAAAEEEEEEEEEAGLLAGEPRTVAELGGARAMCSVFAQDGCLHVLADGAPPFVVILPHEGGLEGVFAMPTLGPPPFTLAAVDTHFAAASCQEAVLVPRVAPHVHVRIQLEHLQPPALCFSSGGESLFILRRGTHELAEVALDGTPLRAIVFGALDCDLLLPLPGGNLLSVFGCTASEHSWVGLGTTACVHSFDMMDDWGLDTQVETAALCPMGLCTWTARGVFVYK